MKGRAPTADESRWMSSVADMGCIVCRLHLGIYSPAEIHHINGKTKENAHFDTIGLCHYHHRAGNDTPEYTSRHPYKKRFETRYGTENELLQKTKELIYDN